MLQTLKDNKSKDTIKSEKKVTETSPKPELNEYVGRVKDGVEVVDVKSINPVKKK